jgi:predicted DNA-binding protein (MmcQ/YjbR family)
MDNHMEQRLEIIETIALDCPFATKDFKVEWEATRYQVGNKLFAMIGTNKTDNVILTVKTEPSKVEQWIEMYPFVTPGYYMNKRHWISFLLEQDVPIKLLEEILKESYQLVFSSLSRKVKSTL